MVFGKRPKVLRAAVPDVLEDAANELTGLARLVLQRAFENWRARDKCPWHGKPVHSPRNPAKNLAADALSSSTPPNPTVS